jgi:RHS repeat-associated protein
VSYGLDSAGRVNSISGAMTGQNTSYASNVLYMPWDAIQQASFGSLGLGEAWMYNKRMQPLEVNRTFNSTPLLTVNNYYCPGTTTDCSTNNGNVQSQWIARNGSATPWVQSFGYDGVNRLSQAAETLGQGGTQSWQEAYGYDAYGNRSIASSTFTWSAMTPPGFDPATNRNSGGGWSPATSYDSVGNVTADPMGGAYQYDAENRMVSANGTTYQYDGEGRRVSKSGGGATTTYLYDASGQLLTEYGAVAAASGTQYVGVDGLGSTRLLTDASGNLPPAGGCHDYLPFGTELTQGMAGNRGSCFGGTDGVEEKFTGKERDAETGLDYFGARYFSAAQGRFTSADWSAKPEPVPYADLKDPQTLNLYAYVRNNPLSRRDLDGHCDSSDKATANTKCQDPAKLQVNDYGKNHIVKKETGGTSPQLTTYVDGAGHPTVGYGHKVAAADGLKVGGTVTKEKADALRDADMTSAAGAVQKAVGKTQLSQGEFNALVDLVYNAGPGVLTDAKSPSLMKAIGSGDYAAMSDQLQYSKDDKGKQEPGLVTRSNERKEIFTGKEPE